MTRFFADKTNIQGNTINLSHEDAAHIRSLRLRPTETFTVCDSEGTDYICLLGEKNETATAQIIEKRPSTGEPAIQCSVYLALAKGDRLDYAVQKSIELGAYEIILYPSARCIAKPADMRNKMNRLQVHCSLLPRLPIALLYKGAHL